MIKSASGGASIGAGAGAQHVAGGERGSTKVGDGLSGSAEKRKAREEAHDSPGDESGSTSKRHADHVQTILIGRRQQVLERPYESAVQHHVQGVTHTLNDLQPSLPFNNVLNSHILHMHGDEGLSSRQRGNGGGDVMGGSAQSAVLKAMPANLVPPHISQHANALMLSERGVRGAINEGWKIGGIEPEGKSAVAVGGLGLLVREGKELSSLGVGVGGLGVGVG